MSPPQTSSPAAAASRRPHRSPISSPSSSRRWPPPSRASRSRSGIGCEGSPTCDRARPRPQHPTPTRPGSLVRRRALPRAPEIEAPVSARFEELDWQDTRMGELTLRRRADPATGEQIYEVKLKDEYLM